MPEILNSSNVQEINDSMNFEVEMYKSKPTTVGDGPKEKKSKMQNLEGLFKKFFTLKLKSPGKKKKVKAMKKPKKKHFEAERIKFWDEMTRKNYKEFHKLDRVSKYKLSKIISSEISKKRFQDLVIPKETAPNSLKRVFQYLAHTVKTDLIAECTTEPTNYRPLTFPPEFIYKESVDRKKFKKHSVDLNDWHAANLMIFQNLANLLYGVSLDFCNPSCCPIMTIGKDYEYMWCDGVTFVDPISIPARTYMKFCLLWTQQHLKDPKVITAAPNSSYSTDCLSTWKMMYRRLLRVYAHLYINHLGDFENLGAIGSVLHCMFRRFLLYGIESGLTSKKELLPVKGVLKKLQREFRLNGEYE